MTPERYITFARRFATDKIVSFLVLSRPSRSGSFYGEFLIRMVQFI